MTLISKHNNQTFEIVADQPEVGFYVYVYDNNGKNTHDYLQDTLHMAKEFAFKKFGVSIDSWTTKRN